MISNGIGLFSHRNYSRFR